MVNVEKSIAEKMENTTGLVLLSGAGLNPNIWNALIREMDVPCLAIKYPGRDESETDKPSFKFQEYVETAALQIDEWGKERFIIVGHSIGACVGLTVANKFTGRVKGFVAIGSIIPKPGRSFASALPFPQNLVMPVVLRIFGTKPPVKSIKRELCNDLSAGIAETIINDFTPESRALFTSKINYELPNAKRLYIELANDQSIPLNIQKRMAISLKAHKVCSMDSGHLPMVSKPAELAKVLSDFMIEL